MKVAVLIPCYNEAASVAQVVNDFRQHLPDADIFVYDNGSSDATTSEAARAGAIVRSESLRGKGNVVRRMFADVEADIYVLVDGDDTYSAAAAPTAVEHLQQDGLDMVSIARLSDAPRAYRRGHRLGNWLMTSLIRALFDSRLSDVLTGFRVLSRRFVKSFPVIASEFEIEAEMTVHALELRMPMAEHTAPYKERGAGSQSKLRTYRDGTRILWMILRLLKEERPLQFFSTLAAVLSAVAVILAVPVILTFIETRLVLRVPTAILSTGLVIVAFLAMTCGLVLDTVTLGRRETKRLNYLRLPSVASVMRGDFTQQWARQSDAVTKGVQS